MIIPVDIGMFTSHNPDSSLRGVRFFYYVNHLQKKRRLGILGRVAPVVSTWNSYRTLLSTLLVKRKGPVFLL